MSAMRHGHPGEWARVRGTMRALVPLFVCFTTLGALFASLVWGKYPLVCTLLFGVAVIFTVWTWRKGLLRVEAYFKGARGEERVARILESLPAQTHVFHDLVAGPYHVDHVVVSPSGIYAIETKNWRGEVTIKENEVLVAGALPDRAPLVQAMREARAVKETLQKIGCSGEVVSVLCLASDTIQSAPLQVKGVWVINSNQIISWLQAQPVLLTMDDVQRAVQLLDAQN